MSVNVVRITGSGKNLIFDFLIFTASLWAQIPQNLAQLESVYVGAKRTLLDCQLVNNLKLIRNKFRSSWAPNGKRTYQFMLDSLKRARCQTNIVNAQRTMDSVQDKVRSFNLPFKAPKQLLEMMAKVFYLELHK